MGCVVVTGDKGKERDGTIWLGEDGNETVVIHSRRTAIILRGEALRSWKAMDQKREHTERTTAVTVDEMRVIAVYQPVCNDSGVPVELYRRKVEHQMTMCPRKTTLGKDTHHNSQVGGGK